MFPYSEMQELFLKRITGTYWLNPCLLALLFYFLPFSSQAKEESISPYRKLIISKWFSSEKAFEHTMSLKIDNVPINQLKEINSPFFPVWNINKLFALDISDMNFAKERKILIIDNAGKAHYLETEKDVFAFIQTAYTPEKYSVNFIFEVLLFLKDANGYKFIADRNVDQYINPSLKKDEEWADILKESNGVIIKKSGDGILCKSLFTTLNGNGIVLIEILLSPKSISIIKKKEKILWDLI